MPSKEWSDYSLLLLLSLFHILIRSWCCWAIRFVVACIVLKSYIPYRILCCANIVSSHKVYVILFPNNLLPMILINKATATHAPRNQCCGCLIQSHRSSQPPEPCPSKLDLLQEDTRSLMTPWPYLSSDRPPPKFNFLKKCVVSSTSWWRRRGWWWFCKWTDCTAEAGSGRATVISCYSNCILLFYFVWDVSPWNSFTTRTSPG
jgi:hypothetical protein